MQSSPPTAAAAPAVLRAEPQLFTTDIARACSFYADLLGFETVFAHGDPPFYAQIHRGGARLNLRHTGRPAFDPEFRSAEADPLAATVVVGDAEPIFLEFEAKGVDFHQRLRTEPWGARTFIVRDPDGNLICFAAAAKGQAAGA